MSPNSAELGEVSGGVFWPFRGRGQFRSSADAVSVLFWVSNYLERFQVFGDPRLTRFRSFNPFGFFRILLYCLLLHYFRSRSSRLPNILLFSLS